MKIKICALLSAVWIAVTGCVSAAPVPTTKSAGDDAWITDMLALRAKYTSARTDGLVQSDWYRTQDMPSPSLEESLFPEKGVDLNAKDAGGKLVWEKKAQWNDGAAYDLQAGDHTATYIYRTITCNAPTRLPVMIGSDDGVVVWLNGKKVLSNNTYRMSPNDLNKAVLDLNPSKNELLIKVYNISGGSGYVYISGPSVEDDLDALADKYPMETGRFCRYFPNAQNWFVNPAEGILEQSALSGMLQKLGSPAADLARLEAMKKNPPASGSPEWLRFFDEIAFRASQYDAAKESSALVNFEALRMSIEDLSKTYGSRYKNAAAHLKALDELEKEPTPTDAAGVISFRARYDALARKALILDNPVVDFDKILLVKRAAGGNMGLPQNWQGNTSMNSNMENEIATLAFKDAGSNLVRVYRPDRNVFVGDVDLHFDGDRMLFSSIGSNGRWQVFEIKTDGTGLRQVTSSDPGDIDNYDAIYLPDGRIIYDSTSGYQGVPCVSGGDYVANLHLMSADGKTVRRLCFEQDNDWYPAVMPDGRIMYSRWEYTDSAHYFSRVMMRMNPDGTGQSELYGSNSYWPNGLWYARCIPGSNSKFVAIVSGHHGVARSGELAVFDTSKGRQADTGAVQRIPGFGKKVSGPIRDQLVNDVWPQFLHPYPLSDKFFLVSCRPTPNSSWGLYLVDIYDNMVLLKEEPGYALFEPLPLKKTPKPTVIPDRVKLAEKDATVAIQNIYHGKGLQGVPAGTVKSLRIYQYEYSYRNMGGHYEVGMEGPWDIRRIIGTVPVYADGSAHFKIPANTPIAVQPLDSEGKSLQLIRSWFVGMPGEQVSCVGCHEPQNASIPTSASIASRRLPDVPKSWYGPTRGFSFIRDVQPVLDKNCVGCHNGQSGRPDFSDTTRDNTSDLNSFPRSYNALHPFIRRNGPEGDYSLLTPLEFHADTSDLVQMLTKGHHGVKLSQEDWDHLITWIDLNVPCYGTWHEARNIPGENAKRRYELKKLFAGVDEDVEAIPTTYTKLPFVPPAEESPKPQPVVVPGWPFDAASAKAKQAEAGKATTLDIGEGLSLTMQRIPAGEFEMGDLNGEADEYPTARVRIDKPFWMASTEITLEQFQAFDPSHRNGYYDMHYKDQVKPGYLMDAKGLPVIRVSWDEAMAFCKWLSQKTGKKVTLPTEAQWEWACRAGTGTSLFYGDLNADFSRFANLGDRSLKKLAVVGVDPQPIGNPNKFWDFVPKDDRFDDGVLHLAGAGKYQPNAWGLFDMHGNVAEWTRNNYRLYPYSVDAGKDDANSAGKKVVRGGSWYDRPKHARSAYRQAYPGWQKVYNVGFRVIIEE